MFTGYFKSQGQKYINKNSDKKFHNYLIKLININKLDYEDPITNTIVNSINESGKLNFKTSNQEKYYCYKLNNINLILQYLTFRYKFFLSTNERVLFEAPLYLLVEPVSSCNLRCPMCFQIDKSFTRKPYMGIMKWELFIKIIDEANDIGVGAVTLASRGEPTMHPRFGEMLQYISSKKNIYELKINTNATFLNEKICHEILRSKVSIIVISADHYKKEQFESIRKGANFDKVVNNVKQLYNIRKNEYPDSGAEIRISAVDFYRKLDRKEFKNFWIKFSDNVSATYASERWDTYNNLPSSPAKIAPCPFLTDRMYIWFDGKCNPCDADYKSYLSYGDVNNNSIIDIWKSTKIENYRKIHENGQRNTIVPCDRCGVDFV